MRQVATRFYLYFIHSIDTLEIVSESQFGSALGQPIFLDQLNCDGTENRLVDCRRYTGIGLHTCDHSQDVGLRCEGKMT